MSSTESKLALMESFAKPMPTPQETMAFFERKHSMLPARIYQYRSLGDYSIEAIQRQAVWMRGPLGFNDPYDSAFAVHLSLHENIEEEARRAFNEDGRRSEDEICRAIDALKQVAELSRQRVSSDLIEGMRKTLKLACFSEVPDSLLMWAHYADSHRGYLVEYDMTSLTHQRDLDFARLLFPVVYGDDFSSLIGRWDFLTKPETGSDIHYPIAAACHKASDWSYEREWRAIIGFGAMTQDGWLHTPVPSRVILGARLQTQTTGGQRLLEVLGEHSIPYSTASFMPDSFKMKLGNASLSQQATAETRRCSRSAPA